MGCDGGTIPRRDELVRVAKKPEQKDKESELAYRWRHCAITQQPLQEPIVMCGLGRLYSKQNVIEHLLEKDKMPESAKHLRSLRDVKQLSLTHNPNYSVDNLAEGGRDVRSAPFICKLIGLEMTGKYRFVAFWSCGCVISERALKEINSANVCSLCQQPFSDDDVIVLNGDEETVEQMLIKMQTRAVRAKADRKDKKSADKKDKKSKQQIAIVEDRTTEADANPTSGGKSTFAPSSAILVSKDFEAGPSRVPSKRPVPAGTGVPITLDDPELKRLKSDSVASDPKASEVYKSIFTSHSSEREQTRAHWVTYNPFYN